MKYKETFIYSVAGSAILLLVFVVYCYLLAASTGFQGRRGGPQDAFRHIYASALVARYLSPSMVKLATTVLEGNNPSRYNQMDRHNNNLGIQIGIAEGTLYSETMIAVQKAQEISIANQATAVVLSPKEWNSGF